MMRQTIRNCGNRQQAHCYVILSIVIVWIVFLYDYCIFFEIMVSVLSGTYSSIKFVFYNHSFVEESFVINNYYSLLILFIYYYLLRFIPIVSSNPPVVEHY